jgi:hypothetical protein
MGVSKGSFKENITNCFVIERLTRDARANAMLIEQLKAIGLATEAAEKH